MKEAKAYPCSLALVTTIAALLVTQATLAQVPTGSQFQVNSYTTSSQASPDVAVAPDGDFVVVWQSFGSAYGDTSTSSIQAQRHASDGTAVTAQFQVNTYTTGGQTGPEVAMDMDGDFVVVWQSFGSADGDTLSFSIQGQRYASNGSALVSQFQVNSYTTSTHKNPAVAVDADGGFVVDLVQHRFGGRR